jgi:hypothetical protein
MTAAVLPARGNFDPGGCVCLYGNRVNAPAAAALLEEDPENPS